MDKSLINKKLCMDGLELLGKIGDNQIDCCIVDFQYRGVLDAMSYGNEGARQKGRALLNQMDEPTIIKFLSEITRVIKPSSYAFMWVDKFHLVEGSHLQWFGCVNNNSLKIVPVDLITWDKGLIGMGYRTRRKSEYLLVYQKLPKTTRNWDDKSIPDVIEERIPEPRSKTLHAHRKPAGLIEKLVNSVTCEGDIVIDPCAGSFSTLDVCKKINRNFVGCDIEKSFCDE